MKRCLIFAFVLTWQAMMLAQASGSHEKWDLQPDVVLEPDSSYVVAAHSGNTVHEFDIPSEQFSDRWIRGLDFHPGDSRVVQSAWIYVKKTGQWLGGWVPGQDRMIAFPDGVAAQLPAGSSVVMEVHYKALDEDVSDRSELGLFFANTRPLRPLSGVGIESTVMVPSGSTPLQVRKEFTIISDSYAIELRPEMLTAGQSLEVTAVDPAGHSSVLLNEPHYREDSEIPYILSSPQLLPKGSKIIATASYRNLTPAPLEDMFRLSVALYPSSDHRIAPLPRTPVKSTVRPARKKKPVPLKKKPAPAKGN